jgi:hypothetical protein
VASLTRERLEEPSAESAGTNHPAVLMLVAAPDPASPSPAMAHDEALNTWGAVVPLQLEVKGESGKVPLPLQWILIGMAMNENPEPRNSERSVVSRYACPAPCPAVDRLRLVPRHVEVLCPSPC